MIILEQIDALAANTNKMTIERAKRFCKLYDALYLVFLNIEVDPSDLRIIETRMQEIHELKTSITDYETSRSITLSKALKVLGETE